MQYEHEESCYNPKAYSKKELQFFRIPDLQKIKPPIIMKLYVNYSYSYAQESVGREGSAEETIDIQFTDAPLYSGIMAEEY